MSELEFLKIICEDETIRQNEEGYLFETDDDWHRLRRYAKPEEQLEEVRMAFLADAHENVKLLQVCMEGKNATYAMVIIFTQHTHTVTTYTYEITQEGELELNQHEEGDVLMQKLCDFLRNQSQYRLYFVMESYSFVHN